jgi:hypothetical protein
MTPLTLEERIVLLEHLYPTCSPRVNAYWDKERLCDVYNIPKFKEENSYGLFR